MARFEDIQDIQEQLASYVLGDLTPEEVAEVHQLLATHPELEAEISQLQKTLALFPLALPEVELPAGLGSQILQRASDSLTAPMTMGDGNVRKKKLIPWPSLIGGLAAAMVAGLGFYSYRLNQQVMATRNELLRYQEAIALLRQPQNRLLSLKGTEAIPAASGSLVVVPQAETIILTLQQVKPLPKDQIYRLWGVLGEQKVFCGEFTPDRTGSVLVKFPLDAEMSDSSAVVITIEPVQKYSYPTGKTVMTGSL